MFPTIKTKRADRAASIFYYYHDGMSRRGHIFYHTKQAGPNVLILRRQGHIILYYYMSSRQGHVDFFTVQAGPIPFYTTTRWNKQAGPHHHLYYNIKVERAVRDTPEIIQSRGKKQAGPPLIIIILSPCYP